MRAALLGAIGAGGEPPINTAAPVIGPGDVPAPPTPYTAPILLACTSGTWNDPSVTLVYNWYEGGVLKQSNPTTTFNVLVGGAVYCAVVATNAYGSTSANSNTLNISTAPGGPG